jgi:hypothetical protein
MGKDKRARRRGEMNMAMWGIIVGAAVDTMRAARIPNCLVHYFLDQVEDGTDAVLCERPHEQAITMIDAVRVSVPSND